MDVQTDAQIIHNAEGFFVVFVDRELGDGEHLRLELSGDLWAITL
ncbi:hypothetical protein [Arthrobacter sp. HLT1-21]